MIIALTLAAMLAQAPPSAQAPKPLKVKKHRNTPPTAAQIDAVKEKAKARGVAASGVHVSCDAKALSAGSWHKLPGGRPVWLLQLESPGAKAVRLHFKGFDAGKDQVWIHAGKEVAGPYAGQGPNGDGEFWTDTIFASAVTLEFVPSGAKPKQLPFAVDLISHQF
jgi:hypothetical protein